MSKFRSIVLRAAQTQTRSRWKIDHLERSSDAGFRISPTYGPGTCRLIRSAESWQTVAELFERAVHVALVNLTLRQKFFGGTLAVDSAGFRRKDRWDVERTQKAIGNFYDDYSIWLYGIALAIVNTPVVADEVLFTLFREMSDVLPLYEGKDSRPLLAWSLLATRRIAIAMKQSEFNSSAPCYRLGFTESMDSLRPTKTYG